MSLDIEYSVKLEEQRIKNTLEKLSWYENLGYKPRFPKDVNPKTDNLKKIYTALLNEYTEEDYKRVATEINKKFFEIENNFCDKLHGLCGKRIKRNFKLILTKYGVGGSYFLPNKIIYNFSMKSFSINTILHEITHLIIEPYIKRYQIKQNEKERIVDLILTSESIILPNYKMQKRGEEHKKFIDPLFSKYFRPPINNFFRKLEELNKKLA